MPISELKFIKRFTEFKPRADISKIPPYTRGIYALLKRKRTSGSFDVVYVGMAGGEKAGIKGRLNAHAKSKTKSKLWTHFSIFEVWDNITRDEVKELEGLFRQIYRKDSRANKLNRQKQFNKLKKVRKKDLSIWD